MRFRRQDTLAHPMKNKSKPHLPPHLRKATRASKYSRALAGASLFLGSFVGSAADVDPKQLTEIPLDQLMQFNYQVTSPSKRPEKLSDAAASIFVITDEDIRRSGVTSIPEALRLSPGVEVARQDSHTWAISSRGFNDEFANQLLVLIDGRSVYTPLFAGVYWDACRKGILRVVLQRIYHLFLL